MRLLIIEDEVQVQDLLRRLFRKEGFEVELRSDGESGLEAAESQAFHLIILDIGLPGLDGFGVLKSLRSRGCRTPVLVLTSLESEEGLVRTLDLGADNFLRKPFSTGALQAHVRALLRRSAHKDDLLLGFGDLQIDLRRRLATRNGKPLRLTPTQFKLLVALVQAGGKTVSRETLLKEVWGFDFDPGTKVLEVQLSYLRSKLGKLAPPIITSVRGVGYRLSASTEP